MWYERKGNAEGQSDHAPLQHRSLTRDFIFREIITTADEASPGESRGDQEED
jgi:hypothetical protein